MVKSLLLSVITAGSLFLCGFAQNIKIGTYATVPSSLAKGQNIPNGTAVSFNGQKCGTGILHDHLMATDPVYKSKREQEEKNIKKLVGEWMTGEKTMPPVYTVPLVFHVIHKGEAVGTGTNISDAQIQSTIAAMNRDFRRNSSDGGIAMGGGPDTEIQFCLATKDPQGNPTTGINRVNGTSVSNYSNYGIISGVNETQVKALSKWPNQNYVNIWVVSEIDSNGADISNPNYWGGGTLAYAYLPGASSAVDGIVVVNICVGNDPQNNQGFRIWPYTLTNRTLTHEMGHVLGLYHPFDDSNAGSCTDGDGIADTPPAKSVNLSSCSNPTGQGACSTQNIALYMDYTPEDCQNMFSAGQSNDMRAVLASSRYSLTTSSNTNCTNCVTATVTINSTNPTCSSNSGSATANATGGTSPYSYLWSNGLSTQTISNLGPGSYSVTVTSTGGCSTTQSVSLSAPGAPTVTLNSTNTSAPSNCDGTASVTASGGTSPYTYQWSNSGTTAAITGLCAGAYTVTVTAANGCTATGNVTISNPSVGGCDTISNFDVVNDTASLYGINTTSCGGAGWGFLSGHNCYGDIAKADFFTATSGDTVKSAIIYFGKASAGSPSSSVNITIWNGSTGSPGAALGTQTVLISQLSTTQPVLINFSPAVVVPGNFFLGVELNYGTPQDTVAIVTNKIGESAPGAGWEQWNDNSWYSYADSLSYGSDLSHAIWVVKCTPGTVNCSGFSSNATSVNPSCTTNNGTATVTATGGTSPYTYLWSNSGTTSTITSLSAGTYTVTVYDANSCTTTCTVTLTAPAGPTVSVSGVNTTGACDGSATATASGGTSPYTYQWSNNGTTAAITGLCAGAYTVTVTAANGCTATGNVTISNPSVGGCDTISNFDVVNDTASLYGLSPTSCGGAGWGYLSGHNCYGDIAKADFFTATSGDTVKSAIIYFGKASAGSPSSSVNITIWNGSTGSPGAALGTQTVLINQLSTTQPVLINFSPAVVVPGNFFLGVELNYGTPQDTVAIVTNQTGESAPGAGWEQWNDNSWYSYADSLSYGTDLSHAIWVVKCTPGTVNCSGFSSTATSVNPTCTTNNGTATVTATGGTSPYTYLWSNSGTTSTITALSAGTYTVTVYDANSCTTTSTVTLTAPAGPTVSVSGVNPTGACDGSATATASGGTSPYTYQWSNNGTTAAITGLCAGAYTVTVTAANGCTATGNVTISNPSVGGCDTISNFDVVNDTASLYGINTTSCGGAGWGFLSGHNCYGDIAKADFFTAASGDTVKSAIIYFGKASAGSPSSSVNITIWNGSTGSPGAALGTQTVLISQLSTTQPVLINFSPAVVVPGNFFLGVELNYGTPQDTVAIVTNKIGESAPGAGWEQWNDNSWYSYADTLSYGADLSHAIWVVKCVGSSVNCSGFSASAMGNDPGCGLSNGTATVSASGGNSPYTYLWTNGNTSPSLTGLTAGVYTVTVTASNSCTATASVTLAAQASPVISASSTNASCGQNNGSAAVTVSGGISPYLYNWSTGGTGPSLSMIPAGNYSVTVTGANGCSAVDSVVVGLPPSPSVSINPVNATCNQNNGTAAAVASGGTSPYSYLWSGNQTTDTVSGLAPGTYSITVTAADSCIATATAVISNNGNVPVLSVTSNPNSGCGTNNGSATVTATGASTPYSYLWSNGGTTPSITGLASGTYTVTVNSANCTATASATVGSASVLAASLSSQNSNCTLPCNGTITVSPTGGASPYTYVWSNGGSTNTQSGLCAGNYFVTISDNGGCSLVKQASITALSSPMNLSSSKTNATCNNPNGTATVNVIPGGGTAPFTYLWSTNPPQTTPTATALSGGQYQGIVTDSLGCKDTVTVTVINNGGPTANITSDPTICLGDSTILIATGGTSYLWSTGQTSTFIKVSPPSTSIFTVTVTDSYQCTDVDSATVTVNTKPITTVTASDDTVCKGETVMLVASGGSTFYWASGETEDTIYVNPDQTKIYIVTAKNGNCTGNTVSIQVNVFSPAPNAVASSDVSITYISQGGTVNFSSAGSSGTSFGWDFTGNGTIDATTANSSYSYSVAGTYSVILSVTFAAYGNCTDYDTLTIIVENVPGTGIIEEDQSNLISIHPNPNDGKFLFQSKNNCRGDNCTLRIYNLIGELVYFAEIKEEKDINIDLGSQATGLYYVNLCSESKVISKKITLLR